MLEFQVLQYPRLFYRAQEHGKRVGYILYRGLHAPIDDLYLDLINQLRQVPPVDAGEVIRLVLSLLVVFEPRGFTGGEVGADLLHVSFGL